jgi:hypothetical protein
MTDKQPKALWLADELEKYTYDFEWHSTAADELRRLHEESQVSYMNGYESAKGEYRPKLQALEDINAELVEALRLMNIECQHLHHAKKDQHGYDVACPVVERIKTSIAKATGEQQ